MKEIDYKVPGGKLLRLQLQMKDDVIEHIQIMGDFFLHPEDTIELIEHALKNSIIREDEIISKINDVLAHNEAILLGATSKDIAHAILLAYENSH
jgi:lipoate-protein ligase A